MFSLPAASNTRALGLMFYCVSRIHIKESHEGIEPKENFSPELFANADDFVCLICVKKYNGRQNLKNHLVKTHLGLEDGKDATKDNSESETPHNEADKHDFDDLININISKTGIETWSVSGDIEFEISSKKLDGLFMDQFTELTNVRVNELLQMELINTKKVNLVNVSIQNIFTYEDYKKSKEVIEGMVTTKEININKFNKNTISYQLSFFGDIDSLTNEFISNNFFQVKDSSIENLSIDLSYVK